MRLWRAILALFYQTFHWKFAVASALFNGGLVLLWNRHHTVAQYLSAGGFQALYSFFLTGVTARVVQYFSSIKAPLPSYALGSIVPATLTFMATLTLHKWNATPELVESWLTPTLTSFVTSFGTNFLTRGSYVEVPGKYKRKVE